MNLIWTTATESKIVNRHVRGRARAWTDARAGEQERDRNHHARERAEKGSWGLQTMRKWKSGRGRESRMRESVERISNYLVFRRIWNSTILAYRNILTKYSNFNFFLNSLPKHLIFLGGILNSLKKWITL